MKIVTWNVSLLEWHACLIEVLALELMTVGTMMYFIILDPSWLTSWYWYKVNYFACAWLVGRLGGYPIDFLACLGPQPLLANWSSRVDKGLVDTINEPGGLVTWTWTWTCTWALELELVYSSITPWFWRTGSVADCTVDGERHEVMKYLIVFLKNVDEVSTASWILIKLLEQAHESPVSF